MERDDREAVASFLLAEQPFTPGTTVSLGDEVARHVRVRRLGVGACLALLDGHGHRALGTIVRLNPTIAVEIGSLTVASPPPSLHLLVPIADKDRMMWLAEKVAELGVTSWRPILYRRSRSVKPRGEGPTFTSKVKARMGAALEQSGGRWLPSVYPESTLARAIPGLPTDGIRLVLDPGGSGILATTLTPPVTVAIGPEGGLEDDELQVLEEAGFSRVALGGDILRFETAAIAGAAIVRATLAESRTHA
ncbi:MAG: 16S rRNA (uracil(1498)-N(3))-methyltransferase [Cytophagaceae bacterium]|nr:16S rRNA (uracil(1498)-N(3))-methyltransferase [Gemmatimonadaceae bacterium]